MQSPEDILKMFMQIMQLHMMYSFSRMGRHPIHPAQIPMIGWIAEHEGCTQADIAEHLNIKPSTVTVSVKRLEAAGHIERMRDDEDQRIWHIYLSEKTRHSILKLKKVVAQEKMAMLRDFSEEDIEQLRGYLKRIKDNLSQVVHNRETTVCEED